MIGWSSRNPKGRANAARPFACLALAAGTLVAAPAAHAIPTGTPILQSTNPVSPGATPTPRIKGDVGIVETKAIRTGIGVAAGPLTRADDPSNIVRLYTEPECAGVVAGEGTVAELGDAGILVTSPVPDETTVTFYANQSDSDGTSPCSVNGIEYRYVTAAPEAPIFTSVSPASGSNENSPRLIGTADPDATVLIYAGAECGGSAVASGSGDQFGSGGIAVSVADNSESTFSARASMAGYESDCTEQPIAYLEVTPASEPGGGDGGGDESGGGQGGGGESGGDGGSGSGSSGSSAAPAAPKLRTVPGGSANDNTPLVTGSAPGAATVRVYADEKCGGSPVAKGSLGEFQAGLRVQVVDNETTTFTAVAVADGKASSCSDPVTYVEDSLTPRTRITMGPAAKTAKRKAVLRFVDTTGNSPGTTFTCRIDKRKWKQCTSPLRLRKLRPKSYVVRVKATDPAGNAEAKAAKRRFKVIRRP